MVGLSRRKFTEMIKKCIISPSSEIHHSQFDIKTGAIASNTLHGKCIRIE